MRLARSRQPIAAALLAVCGIYQVALGLYFIAWRPSLLPEDLRFMSDSAEALQAAPGLAQRLQWVFAVMGGQMVAVGMLVLLIAVRFRKGEWASWGDLFLLATAAAASVALMSAANFAIHSDFRFLLLTPVAFWVGALVLLSRRTAQ